MSMGCALKNCPDIGQVIQYRGDHPAIQIRAGVYTGMQSQLAALAAKEQIDFYSDKKIMLMGPYGEIEIDRNRFIPNPGTDSWLDLETGQSWTNQFFIDRQVNEYNIANAKVGDMTAQQLMDAIKIKNQDPPKNIKETTMFGEFKRDVKFFMHEHKGLIYGILGLYLLDHFVLEGKLKAKLLELAHKLIGKLETKVDAIGASTIEQK